MTPLRYTASAQYPDHPVSYCLDSSVAPNSFWEAPGNPPYWAQIEFSAWLNFSKYSLSSGPYGSDRMPISWELQGSSDGQTWTTLDTRTNEPTWSADETREYEITQDFTARFIRLYVTAGGTPGILRLYEFKPDLDFQILSPGILAWRELQIGKTPVSPLAPDGAARAGGSIWMRPIGDQFEGGIHILPCTGEPPTKDGICEVGLNRSAPEGNHIDIFSLACLAQEDMPYALILERSNPFRDIDVIQIYRESETPNRKWHFQRYLTFEADGSVKFGRNKGTQTDEAVTMDETPRKIVFEHDDPQAGDGDYDSPKLFIVAKKKSGNEIERTEYIFQATQRGLELRKNGELILVFGGE